MNINQGIFKIFTGGYNRLYFSLHVFHDYHLAFTCMKSMKKSSLFVNGRVHCLSCPETSAASILVENGIITALDPDKNRMAAVHPSPDLVDLKGATVLPGFIDTHVHVASLGRIARSFANLYRARSIAAIVDSLKEKAAEQPQGPLAGFGPNFRADLLAEGRLPAAADLDRVAKDRPVVLHDVNKYIVNSYVLARIAPEALAKSKSTAAEFGKNVLFSKARGLVPPECHVPVSSGHQLEEDIVRALKLCAANGLTCVVNASVTMEQCRILRRLNRAGKIPIKMILLMFEVPPDKLAAEGITPELVEGRLTFGPLKYFWDMFVMHRSALMHEPYLDEPDNHGKSFVPPDEFRKKLRAAFDAGWPVGVHCTGDRALDDLAVMLLGEKERMAGLPPSHVIHAYFPSPRAMEICRSLRIGFAVQPAFIRDWGDTLPEFIGAGRAARFLPLKTMLAENLSLGGGSDAPIVGMAPIADMAAAMSRRTAGGKLLDQSECLGADEALQIYTRGAATLVGKENVSGAIETGMAADFTVLDRDPRGLAPGEVEKLKVLMTVTDGRIVCRNDY